MQRGFIHLQNKNYQKAIDDFNTVIKRNGQIDRRIYSYTGDKTYFLQKHNLYKTCLFRSLAFALSGDMRKSCKDYDYLLQSNCEMKYPYFIFFAWAVLKHESEKATGKPYDLGDKHAEIEAIFRYEWSETENAFNSHVFENL